MASVVSSTLPARRRLIRDDRQNKMGLDTVELIMGWEEAFGITIAEADACAMRTTADVIDHIYAKLKDGRPEDEGSLTIRAFFRLRQAFHTESLRSKRFTLDRKISELLPSKESRNKLNAILQSAGFTPLSRLPFGLQFTAGRVRDLTLDSMIKNHGILRKPGQGWSRRQVREITRAVMTAQFALKNFSDSARIVKDLGLG